MCTNLPRRYYNHIRKQKPHNTISTRTPNPPSTIPFPFPNQRRFLIPFPFPNQQCFFLPWGLTLWLSQLISFLGWIEWLRTACSCGLRILFSLNWDLNGGWGRIPFQEEELSSSAVRCWLLKEYVPFPVVSLQPTVDLPILAQLPYVLVSYLLPSLGVPPVYQARQSGVAPTVGSWPWITYIAWFMLTNSVKLCQKSWDTQMWRTFLIMTLGI